MTQPTAELLQAIKGLAEKRDNSPEIRAETIATYMQIVLYDNLPTIIAALELKERVEKAGGYMLVNGNPLMPQSGGAAALKGPTNAG